MRFHACLTAVLLLWSGAIHAQRDPRFCFAVDVAVTVLHEQSQATSFCSSYLKLSTVRRTRTVTSTTSVITTAVTTITTTSTPTVFITAQAVSTVNSDVTLDTTITDDVLSTTVVATDTVFTATDTQFNTITVPTQSTTTTTITSTAPLTGCTRPVFVNKRQLGNGSPVPVPKAFSAYRLASVLSRACSCLSVPRPTSTQTRTVSTTKTITSPVTVTTTQAANQAVTLTTTTTSTTTLLVTIYRTQTVVNTITVSSTFTTSLVSTTTSTSTSTSTQTSTATSTVQRYSNFALLHSGKGLYGSIQDSVGGSGQGVYFNDGDLGTAATFSFTGTKLYYDNQYVQTYAASSGNYYVVVERPYAQFGYYMDCTLGTPSFSGDGCPLDCSAGGGFFDLSTGNDETNYGGAWGFQGSTDNFIVYAVGQT